MFKLKKKSSGRFSRPGNLINEEQDLSCLMNIKYEQL